MKIISALLIVILLLAQTALAEVDFSDRAMEYLEYISENFGDRSGAAGDGFGDWLISELLAAGYDPAQVTQQRFTGTGDDGETVSGRNIVLTVPGETAETILVGAHYDGAGAGDNGSGTALLLATAAGLRGETPVRTLKYVFFDAEEQGMVGSGCFAAQMSAGEVASTALMVNIDSIAFGDFCCLYGGVYGDDYGGDVVAYDGEPVPEPTQTEGYQLAADAAERLGFKVYRTADLDGYFDANGMGMQPEDGAFFTNPWTVAHPAPLNMVAPSPATAAWSDHAPFAALGIPYLYFEATNWWAFGNSESLAYTGYFETYDELLGEGGMFMNTEYDTLENLKTLFPGRAEQHFRQYSPLLAEIIMGN